MSEIKAREIQVLPIGQIKLNPKNRNKHTPEQIERLKQIIEYQGFRAPVVISNRSGRLVAGHGRFLAARELGMTELPAIFQDFDSDEQEYAAGVSDNSIAAWAELDLSGINTDLAELGPDFEIDLLGIKDFTLDMSSEKDEPDEDEIPENSEPRTKLGDLYELGEHRLLCGDSTKREDVERLMAGEKAEILFTSPPYADLRDYQGGLTLDPSHLAKFFDWPAKTFIVNLGLIIRKREIVRYWDDYLLAAANRSLKLLAWNVWDKGHASAAAHQQAMFGLCHEWIFVFGEYKELNLTKPNKLFGEELWAEVTVREKDGSLHVHSGAGKIRSHRQLDSTIRLDGQKNYSPDYVGHPAQFPVSLPEEYINAATDDSQIVADPFLGSGSTLIACEKTGRRCFGMEIDPHYCDVIIFRWEKYTGRKAELIGQA